MVIGMIVGVMLILQILNSIKIRTPFIFTTISPETPRKASSKDTLRVCCHVTGVVGFPD